MRFIRLFSGLPLFIFSLLFQGYFCPNWAQTPWPTNEWTKAVPEDLGIHSAKWDQWLSEKQKEQKFPYLNSLVIIKDGYLVFEEYFNGFNADRLNGIQSVTKSFTSAIIGMAIDQGFILGVEEKVLSFFPDTLSIENLDDRKKDMALEDILTMRTGTDYEEGYPGSPHNSLNRLRKGWDTFYLNRPLIRDPGSGFQYDSGGVILLSSMLKNRSGMHADDFAEKYLFPHLGIAEKVWIENNEGHPHTGGGLHLKPLDMAKLGLLYLRGGIWEDTQLIPAEWVKASFQEHHSFGSPATSKTLGYGYLWWILRPDPQGLGEQPIYAARGYGGQNIFIIPEYDMIVVTTSNWAIPNGGGDPPQILYNYILPALHD